MIKRIALLLLCTVLVFFAVMFGVYSIDQEFRAKETDMDVQAPVSQGSGDNNNMDTISDTQDTILVALYNSGYLYHENHDHGINKDILDELSKRLGLKFDIRVMPRARIYSMIEEGSLPVSMSTVKTVEREIYSWFVPYFCQKNDTLIREDLNITTEEELLNSPDVKVGIIRGYYYGKHYARLIEKLKEKNMVVEAKDTETLFRMLKDDWIQVTFNLSVSYLYYFDIFRINNMRVLDWAPDDEPLERCISLSKQYFTVRDVELIRAEVEKMKEDGTIYEIFNRYLSKEEMMRTCILNEHLR